MKLKPSRIIFTLLLMLVITNGLWVWRAVGLGLNFDTRDAALMEQARGLTQLRTMAAASLTGRKLSEIEPTLRRLFPEKQARLSDDPKAFIIGDVVLTLDPGDHITGVATFVPEGQSPLASKRK